MRTQKLTSIFKSTSTPQSEFTVTAATDVVTSSGHGLSNGDQITVASTTTLPSGIEADKIYYVINSTTDTFKVSENKNGESVDITDTGTGTHTFTLLGRSILVDDFESVVMALDTKNSANLTIKFVGSVQEDSPIWTASQSETNQYEYLDVLDYEDGSSIDGDTGISPAGTDDNRMVKVNIEGLRWISAVVTSYTAGNVSLTIKPYSN